MKKISLLILILISITAFAQKGKITSAWGYLKDGYLDDAKKAIDQAELHDETKDSYKTYFFKGKIYRELGVSKNKKYSALCKDIDCIDVAYEALMKSIKLNFVKEENKNLNLTDQTDLMKFGKVLMKQDSRDFLDSEAMIETVAILFPAISGDLVNQGVLYYQNGKFEDSYQKFTKALSINFMSIDTALIYYTSLAGLKTDHYKEVVALNEQLIKFNYGSTKAEKVSIYQSSIIAYSKLNDTVKMIKVLDEGINKFPNDNYPLILEAYNYYVSKENNNKALEYINMAIEKDGKNPQYYAIKGTLLEGMKRKNAAIEQYEKAIALDPNNYDANYGLGALYNNTAADTVVWVNTSEEFKNNIQKQNEIEQIALDFVKKALPYLQKANEIRPYDLSLMDTLRKIYYKNKEMEMFKKIDAEIKALQSGAVQEKTE